MISTIQLKYIVAVDEQKSFVRAASVCGITQPTLSMQIKKLEEILGVIIFDREKTPIKATSKGKEILKYARVALRDLEKISKVATKDISEFSGDLTLGIIPTIAPYLVPLFVSSFNKKYPLVNLVIKELPTEVILKSLEEEKIDAGVLATPVEGASLYARSLFYEKFYFFVNKNHPASKKNKVSPEDFDRRPIYLLEDGHCLRSQAEKICQRFIKGSDTLSFSGGQLSTLMNLVRFHEGATLIPQLALNYMSKSDEALVREFKGTSPAREVSILVSRFFEKEEIINRLEEEIINNLPHEISSHKKSKLKVIPVS